MKYVALLQSSARSLFFDDVGSLPNCPFSHFIVRVKTTEGIRFSLHSISVTTKLSREYSRENSDATRVLRQFVRRVVRVRPLSDLQVKTILMEEFFFRTNHAISISSVWSWHNVAKEILEIFESNFPGQCCIDSNFIRDITVLIERRQEDKQRMKEECLRSGKVSEKV